MGAQDRTQTRRPRLSQRSASLATKGNSCLGSVLRAAEQRSPEVFLCSRAPGALPGAFQKRRQMTGAEKRAR
eukprot:329847-Pyramimonas_sp.AAC.1